jgi:hypothetical protein
MATDNELLVMGGTISDLAALFGIDRKEVRLRIGDIPPRSKRGSYDVWRVRDVAPRLAKIDEDMTEMVRRVLATHHTDLPKMLSKEFWYGQNQRLKYLQSVGELWDTAAVVDLCGEVFKTLRLSLMLSADAVGRESSLTLKQRHTIETMMHAALEDAREKLVVRLSHLRQTSNGKSFAPKETAAIPDGHRGTGIPDPDDDYDVRPDEDDEL